MISGFSQFTNRAQVLDSDIISRVQPFLETYIIFQASFRLKDTTKTSRSDLSPSTNDALIGPES